MTTETKETIGAFGLLGLIMSIGIGIGAGWHSSYLKHKEVEKLKAEIAETEAKIKRQLEFNEFFGNMQVLEKIRALDTRIKALETPVTLTNSWQSIDWGDLVITNLLYSTNIMWLYHSNTNVYLNTR